MIAIDKTLISNLLAQAAANPRLRQNFDLHSSEADGSQRMLNALQPGTVVPAGSWHTLVAMAPTLILEVKDGRYGEDESENFCNNQ